MESLESGGRWTWSAHVLGVTTGNLYFGPEVVFPAATPRPLIGKGDERRDWDDRDWVVNTSRSDLDAADHLYLPLRPAACPSPPPRSI